MQNTTYQLTTGDGTIQRQIVRGDDTITFPHCSAYLALRCVLHSVDNPVTAGRQVIRLDGKRITRGELAAMYSVEYLRANPVAH